MAQALCTIIVVLLPSVLASLYDPHPFPSSGPFIEGWYIRITDHTVHESYAVLFGTVLPRSPDSGANLAYIGILHSNGSGPLLSKDAFPDISTVKITKNGRESYSDPDVNSAPNFVFRAEPYGHVKVNATNAEIDVRIDDISLRAIVGIEDPWSGNTHLGPEHWLVKLPLPLHWFVYSLGSNTQYEFRNRTSGIMIRGDGTAHMEKNWGKGFPTSWFWVQGHTTDGVTLAMSGGWLKFGPIPVRGHLAGYRNQKRRISLDFRPDNSLLALNVESCRGEIRAGFLSLTHKLVVTVSAPPGSFSRCLYGPMPNGFRQVCSESYGATIEIRLYRRRHYFVGDFVIIDTERLQHSALEFGGEYLCQICHGL